MASLAQRLPGPCGAFILVYHNVLPREAGDDTTSPLHVPQRAFAAELDLLRERCQVVPLATALQAAPAEQSARPQVAITFDDAYHGAVTIGLEELAKREMPATIFVAPGLVGTDSFWWDRLAPPGGPPLSDDSRAFLVDDLCGDSPAILGWAVAQGVPVAQLSPLARPASEPDLTSAARTPGVTLAAHGWSHRNLSRLAADQLDVELRGTREWLADRAGTALDYLAYPYGRHSEAVRAAARAAGFEAGLLDGGGWLPASRADRFQIPRLPVSAGLSEDGFMLRITGLVRR